MLFRLLWCIPLMLIYVSSTVFQFNKPPWLKIEHSCVVYQEQRYIDLAYLNSDYVLDMDQEVSHS